MNVIAQAANLFLDRVIIMAFAVMNNHFHFIISGEVEDIQGFFAFIVKRLSRRIMEITGLKLQIKEVKDLLSLRNNIIYVNRNGYVANPNHTPFSYPWGTGRYYYNECPVDGVVGDKSITELRILFKGRAPQLPDDWRLCKGYVTPDSYCSIRFGMGLFIRSFVAVKAHQRLVCNQPTVKMSIICVKNTTFAVR